MLGKLPKALNIATNICIVVAAILMVGVLAKRLLEKRATAVHGRGPINEVKIGDRLEVPNLDWRVNNQTLVLALRIDCPYCTESAPLYRRLVTAVSTPKSFVPVAVFDEPPAESKAYLSRLNIPINDVRQADLKKLAVRGTPTLMLVNQDGVVTDVWFGKLGTYRESLLLSRLGVPNDSPPNRSNETDAIMATDAQSDWVNPVPPSDVIDLDTLKGMDSGGNVILLDVRNRKDFAIEHNTRAVNIPLDELDVRASNELRSSNQIVTSCYCVDRRSAIAYKKLVDAGFRRVKLLREGT